MRFLNRGILLELIIICLVFLQEYLSFTNSLTILAIILVIYGLISLTTYLFMPETFAGESRTSYLIFGCIYFIGGVLLVSFATIIMNLEKIIFIGIVLIHGISRMFTKKNKGLTIKIISFVWGIILVLLGLYYSGFIIKSPLMVFDIKLYGLIFIVIDLTLLIIYCVLPRNDLINTSVKIDYSSFEDQVIYKKGHSSHEVEVIDLDRLFNRKKGEE